MALTSSNFFRVEREAVVTGAFERPHWPHHGAFGQPGFVVFSSTQKI